MVEEDENGNSVELRWVWFVVIVIAEAFCASNYQPQTSPPPNSRHGGDRIITRIVKNKDEQET
jgi:hypothetical protein